MTSFVSFAVFALIALCAIFLFARRNDRRADQRGLPSELVGAELAYAERTFTSTQQALVARIDRAYRTRDGIALVELKTRMQDRTYMTDIIEMSAQRVALQDETGEAVSKAAWVVVDRNGHRQSHRAALLGSEEVQQLRERHTELAKGVVMQPTPARSRAQCEHCGHRRRCAARFGDRG